MLYAITEFTYSEQSNRYTIPQGGLGVVAFTLAPGGALALSMNQLAWDTLHLPQDQSLRGWISVAKGGNPVVDSPIGANHWSLTMLQKRVIVVYDMMGPAPETEAVSISLMPGAYWLNVLNLVNEANSFALDITPVPGA